jgi:hypothetical protein
LYILYPVSEAQIWAYAVRACASTALVTLVQLSFTFASMVEPNVTPSILTCRHYSIPRGVIGAYHPPTAISRDLLGLSCAPVACSYVLITRFTVAMSLRFVRKIIISSALASTENLCPRLPMVTTGSRSSRVCKRGCTQRAYKATTCGHPCLMAL